MKQYLCYAVAQFLEFEHYFLHRRSTLFKAHIAPCMGFKLMSIMRFGSGAKCLVGKSLENSAILYWSTSPLKVNTHCSVKRLEGQS